MGYLSRWMLWQKKIRFFLITNRINIPKHSKSELGSRNVTGCSWEIWIYWLTKKIRFACLLCVRCAICHYHYSRLVDRELFLTSGKQDNLSASIWEEKMISKPSNHDTVWYVICEGMGPHGVHNKDTEHRMLDTQQNVRISANVYRAKSNTGIKMLYSPGCLGHVPHRRIVF